ncbi:MAG: tRNA threonylcarbamoyladenosine dehydratase [Oscillospiraceae bacterium]|nr:tRNA threonylcarbamoyladenosine dehydratase [Oscillospiraceae bacterium]
MLNPFSRMELLYGKEAMERLSVARVAVFGIGGVGGYIVEALARSGVGELELIDHDRVSVSNLNRQIIATQNTIGLYKTEAARERILEINPQCRVTVRNCFFLPENEAEFDFGAYAYVADAVDMVTAKLRLVEKAQEASVPIISSMGAGNKKHPGQLQVMDIYETSVCPLARVMRKECRKRGIEHLKVVCSGEEPVLSGDSGEITAAGRPVPGSVVFVPAVAGFLMAGEIINDLTKD